MPSHASAKVIPFPAPARLVRPPQEPDRLQQALDRLAIAMDMQAEAARRLRERAGELAAVRDRLEASLRGYADTLAGLQRSTEALHQQATLSLKVATLAGSGGLPAQLAVPAPSPAGVPSGPA